MHIAVCDDSIDELTRICSVLEDYNRERNRSITYEAFHSATDLLETMKEKQYDLLLLDILMPGVTGMEAAKEIRSYDQETRIIFLTSSREFAVESYRVNAEDYLIKPAQKDEIFPTLDKQLTKFAKEEAFLTLKAGGSLVKLPFSQIVYVEVINRSIQFALANGEVREAYGYLTDYEQSLLSDSNFYKPHRSYLVNLRHVTSLDKKAFTTIIGKAVPVARDAYAKTKAVYMKYLLESDTRRDML